MSKGGVDRFLGLLESFHLDRLPAQEREYFLSALTDEERRVVSARLGLKTQRLSLEQVMGLYGLSLERLIAMEMRCARRLALQDHLKT